MVGDGTSIATLDANWLGGVSLARWPTFVNVALLPDKVSGLLDSNGVWSRQLLICFGEDLIDLVLRLPRDNLGGTDKLVWAHTEKDAMNSVAFYSSKSHDSSLTGGNLWKLNAQPRMILHAWPAAINLLSMNHWLFRHNMRYNADCLRGCGQDETIHHMLGECKFISKGLTPWHRHYRQQQIFF
ncbi:hypothetical protein KSP39_PZI014136 [Platanthera zijinensis]|uniref:Reverse transcriptase zinc-binding domain-containing protein n=1 Tax=Platanthera zijinensis TaxID=2320716 RepID=A0AAP0BD31_9ASPA